MEKAYKIVFQGGTDEIVEKRSRFIAAVSPAASEEEALKFIDKVKKEHWNARHNCYAYVIGDRQQLQRFSDDGEPGQTAGKPILDVLLSQDIHNAVIVVTRYFGGILLGTGGLVRAYSAAAAKGLSASRVVEKCPGVLWRLNTDYNGAGKVTYLLGQQKVPVLSSEYTDTVRITAVVSQSLSDGLKKALVEATGGRIGFEEEKKVSFAVVDGTAHLF